MSGVTSNGAGWGRAILVAVASWAASRIVLELIGAYSFILAGHAVPWTAMWVQWDAGYYLSIAQHGYVPPVAVTGLEDGQSNLNFFPLLPIGIWLVRWLVPSPVLAGLVFTNLCLIGAVIFAHRLAAIRAGAEAADWTAFSLLTLTGTFELSGVTTEAPFLFLSFLAVYLAASGRAAGSAAASAGLTITRLTGIVQGAGMAVDWLNDRLRGRPARYRGLFFLALIPLPLLLDAFYMFHLTGDALAPQHSAFTFWKHDFEFPLRNFVMALWTDQPRMVVQNTIGLAFMIVLLWRWRSFSLGEWFFIAVSVISFASDDSSSPSLIRYMMSLYPLHLAFGEVAARSRIGRVLLLLFATLNGAIAVSWFHGGELYV